MGNQKVDAGTVARVGGSVGVVLGTVDKIEGARFRAAATMRDR
jgi:hypothetical protein